jgi:peptidoglycan/xylan/chitin deacetylase (PgdA/CDA1 family)
VRALLLVIVTACAGMDPALPPADPPEVFSIEPATGTVEGGTFVTIRGANLGKVKIMIGDIECTDVASGTEVASCRTGSAGFLEGVRDVVVESPLGSASLPEAFTYACPWTTQAGRRSCGAVPPKRRFPEQAIASWVTQFQPGHGFVATGGSYELDDASDFTLGAQSAFVTTDGAGTHATLARLGAPPIDFTAHLPKLWVKLDGAAHVKRLELRLGSGGLTSFFAFTVESERWISDGEWVGPSLSWSAARVVGRPDRRAISDVELRVVDDGTGPVTLHANGLALVAQPRSGTVSFTFDDNLDSMYLQGLRVLFAHGMAATAYVIVDRVDRPGHTSLAELQTLHGFGWEIAAHAYTEAHHAAGFSALTPAELEDDLVDSRAWLVANGFTGHEHCAYPPGGFDTSVLAVIHKYFATCRTSAPQRELTPPADARKLRVFEVTSATTLDEATAAVDAAVLGREWLIFVFHALVHDRALETQWRIADFEQLAAHVAASKLPVQTIGKVLESW